MKVSFRQGIVSHQVGGTPTSPAFLQLNGSGHVDLLAATKPLTVTVAHRTTDYLHSEDNTVTNAWTGPFAGGTDYWLYIDFNTQSFARTFGETTVEPVAQATEPSSPVTGSHWYDTSTNRHFYYTGTVWVEVLRVFIARMLNGQFYSESINGSNSFAGTQIGNTTSVFAGRVLFDQTGSTIQRDDNTFFTTEDGFFTNQSRVDSLRLESNVARGKTESTSIASFKIVAWKDDGIIQSATYDDVGSTVVGILTEDIVPAIGDAGSPLLPEEADTSVGQVIVQGVVTNPNWNWTSVVDVGSELWVDNTGSLVTTDPHISDVATYPTKQVPIARVLASDTIIFEQGLGGVGPRGATGPSGTSPAATASTLGSVVLSVTPSSSPETPVVVGDNDPRLTDARVPLPHTHNATSVFFDDANVGFTAAEVQAAIEALNGQIAVIDTPALNDITDVTISGSPAIGQLLTFSGTEWVNSAHAIPRLDELTNVAIAGSPGVGHVLTFDGTDWVNSPSSGGGTNNWLIANNGVDFDTPPSAPAAGEFDIALGDSAVADSGTLGGALAIGSRAVGFVGGPSASAGFTTAIGTGATASGQSSTAVGINSQAIGNASIAIGGGDAQQGYGIAIGRGAVANSSRDIVMGEYAQTGTGGTRSIVLGRSSSTSTNVDRAVVIGSEAVAALDKQVVIGPYLGAADVTSDVAFSVKIGNGAATTDKNMLHLFDAGKFELYGDKAQFIVPKYATSSEPANPVEGSLIYDETLDILKTYNGSVWSTVGGDLGDMTVTSIPASDTLTSTKELFEISVNGNTGLNVEEVPDFGYDVPSLTTTGVTATFNPPVNANDMEAAFIRADGLAVYVVDHDTSPGTVAEFLLSTAWDLSSKAGTANATFVMNSVDHPNQIDGVWFNDDGTKMIASGASDMNEYTMSTGFDIANAVYVQTAPAIGYFPSQLYFSRDGEHAYTVVRHASLNQWYIIELSVGTPWDVSTISQVGSQVRIDTDFPTSNEPYVAINNDGTKIIAVGDNTGVISDTSTIREYDMATPYLISTMTLNSNTSTLVGSRFMRNPLWSVDGTKFYTVDSNKTMYEWTSTAVSIGGLITTLYHDSNEKLGTRSTGVEVTGRVSATEMFVVPGYTAGSEPAVVEGGLIYVTDNDPVGSLFVGVVGGSPSSGIWEEVPRRISINEQTGTTYTLISTDAANMVNMNNASANTVTVPTNATTKFPIGTEIIISQKGAGQTTISGGAGSPPPVTINSADSLKSCRVQFSTVSLVKTGVDEWLLMGDLA